jgi:6-pyruvoyltetrahydropterin/6-carboxytetrahydropterin synthase
MAYWEISKEFEFNYGHRVCRHLHGHGGKVVIYLRAAQLVDGMVTDFKHLNWFKKFLDSVLDHKMILDINDPLVKHLMFGYVFEDLFQKHEDGYWIFSCNQNNINTAAYLLEAFEGYVFVEFVPTSENLSQWLYQLVNKKMVALGIQVSKVQFFETRKSQSTYRVVPYRD